jgi:hypothetical protein
MTGKAQHPRHRPVERHSTPSPSEPQHERAVEQADPARLQRAVADRASAGPRDILDLQGAYGNRAVTGLLAGTSRAQTAVQPKLTVGPVGDQYEREADRVAERVMSAPAPAVSGRMGGPSGTGTAHRTASTEGQLQAQPLAASVTPLLQRQEMPEEEELQTKPLLQRQEAEEEELQAKPLLQRQEEAEEEELQTKPLLQRQEVPEEEEVQAKPLLQRQEVPEEEEVQAKPLLQRQEMPEEEEVQGKPIVQRQEAEEEELQAKPLLQRQEVPEEEEVQAKRSADGSFDAGPDTQRRLAVRRGQGEPLPGEVQADMEARFGADFGQVRIHTDGEAVQLSQDLQAQAFTHGQDIYFGAGRYDADSEPGRRLLAHELTHTIQQGASPVRRTPAATPERSADTSTEDPDTVQRKTVYVQDKAHTRKVTKPNPTPRQVSWSKWGDAKHRFDRVEVEDNDATHIKDKTGNVAWYRVKGTTNEYIRASKVLDLEYHPSGDKIEGLAELRTLVSSESQKEGFKGRGSGVETTSEGYSPLEEAKEGYDIPTEMIDSLAGIGQEREEAKTKGESDYSDVKIPNAQVQNLLYASNAMGIAGGMFGFALSIKKLISSESEAMDRVEAVFELISGVGDVGKSASDIAKTAQGGITAGKDLASSKASAFFDSFSGVVKTVFSGVKTIASIVKAVQMLASEKKYSVGEGARQAMDIFQNMVETAQGVVGSIKTIWDAFGEAPKSIGAAVPGLGFVLSGLSLIMKGYYLAKSAYWGVRMSQEKKSLRQALSQERGAQFKKSGLTPEQQKEKSERKFKETRGFYRRQEAIIATSQAAKAKAQATKTKLETRLNRITGTDQKSLERKQALQVKIGRLTAKIGQYDTNINTAKQAVARKETKQTHSGARQFLSREQLGEFELATELGYVNRKRVVRQAIHIGTEIMKVAGEIASLASASGVAAGISIGLKASASGIELSLPFFRAIKQWGRNRAARKMAESGTYDDKASMFNWKKATAAKLEMRKKHAVRILLMAANLDLTQPRATIEKHAKRVENYIRAAGGSPAALYRLNGQPMAQIKLLATAMAKREF